MEFLLSGLLFCLSLMLGFIQNVDGWVLDKRCDDLGYGDLVRGAMVRALEFSKAAQDALQALKDGTNNEAQMDLFEYMFGFAVEKANGQRRVKLDDWETIYEIYTKVLSFAPVRQPNENIPTTDVVIYCDYSRFIEGKNCGGKRKRGIACDKDTSLNNRMTFGWKQCKSNMAYIPLMALTEANGGRRFAQIDLCAWYLKFVSTSKKQFWSDVSMRSIIAKPIHAIVNGMYQRTKMDAHALLDHTILHELTHAPSKDATDDVKGSRSYGWKKCVTIGKRRAAAENADNYAYFGLGARMISPNAGTLPTRPNRNGSISALSDATHEAIGG